ncbi:MAG: lanthionine synthetase LanC family protein [Planctomycetota bacterium]
MTQARPGIESGAFLAGADRIGSRLCRDAHWDGERCNWTGDWMEALGGAWRVAQKSCGPDLYGGTSGIALFLGELYAHTGESEHLRVARGALRQALDTLSRVPPEARASVYSGQTGVAHVLLELGARLQDDEWFHRGRDGLLEVASLDPSVGGLDVVGGIAGTIGALLRANETLDESAILEAAARFGDRLLETAERSSDGLSWATLPGATHANLLGFSHGTAGIAWALAELDHVVGGEQYGAAAREALRYERAHFSPEHGNWPDFRFDEAGADGAQGSATFGCAWCHGAPGSGLGRLSIWRRTRDETLRAEAESALRTTSNALHASVASGQGSHCLCHGSAGNAELALHAAETLEEPAWRSVAEHVGASILARLQHGLSIECGIQGGGESPSLMLGVAGVGHFLLRLAAPSVPSVLVIGPS